MEKKLISFSDEQLKEITEFAEVHGVTFTEGVRRLINYALTQDVPDESTIDKFEERLTEFEKKLAELSWWTADDNTSKLGNIETTLAELEKQVAVVTAASKLFKAHLKDRTIHLQD